MKGTTKGTADKMTSGSKSGVRHGPSQKHVVTKGKRAGRPSAPTSAIKGSDRGGV